MNNTCSIIGEKLNKNKDMISTPSYLYFPELISLNYSSLKECLGSKLIVSIKANSNIDLLSMSSFEKDGYEATSLDELGVITQLGAKEKFINNPSMDQDLINKSIISGATLIIDNLNQIEFISNFKGTKSVNPVMIRVNPQDLSSYYNTPDNSKGDHFGMSVDDIFMAIEKLADLDIKVSGIHIFKGSHTFIKSAFTTLELMSKLVVSCEEKLGYQLEKLNFGGGFGSDWSISKFDFERYREKINSLFSKYDIYHESGRAIFETAGVYATKVISKKRLGDKYVAVCDGGLAHNFLLAQTESTFKKFRSPTFIVKSRNALSDLDTVIVGSSCNQHDVVGKLSSGEPDVNTGDILLFDSCGAYNQSYSPVNFLSLKKASSYLYFLEGEEAKSG